MAERLLDRLEDCRRTFPQAVVLGGAGAQVLQRLGSGRAGIESVAYLDTSQGMLDRARALMAEAGSGAPVASYELYPAGSEELPLEPGSCDREPVLRGAAVQ